MSFFRGRNDMEETRARLTKAVDEGDTESLQKILSEVVGEMTIGADMSPLFPNMVKVCATVDLTCKKLVYLYISQYAIKQPDLALLAINSLQKDASDPNAMVRGLALKTLCNIRLPEFLEYIKQPLVLGLKDRSPYVRQIAVTGSLKVYQLHPEFAKAHGIPAHDQMLYDTDSGVVVNAVRTLISLREDLGQTFSLKQKTVIHLLNRLPEFTDWGKATILQFLLSYQPKTEEEIFDILNENSNWLTTVPYSTMSLKKNFLEDITKAVCCLFQNLTLKTNVLDPLLKHGNTSVSLATINLMLHYTRDMPNIQQDICKKLRGILLTLLTHEQDEMVYISLCHLHSLQKNLHINLAKHYKKLFCRYNDPVHIKCQKIELLEMICTDSNSKEILEELNSHCLDVSPDVSNKAINGISHIAKKVENFREPAVQILMNLLEVDRVAGLAIDALKDLIDLDGFQSFQTDILSAIPSLWATVEDQRGKIAMLWIIGEHGKAIPDAPYLLEGLIDNLEEENRPLVVTNLLTASTKLFFSRPAECQDMLGKLLEFCVENKEDMLLREKGQLYYRLLSEDLTLAERVICSSMLKQETTESDNLENKSLLMINSLEMFFKSKSQEAPKPAQPVSSKESHPPEKKSANEPVEGQLIDIGGVKLHEVVVGDEITTDTSDTRDLNSLTKSEDKSHHLNDTTVSHTEEPAIHVVDSNVKRIEQQDEEGSIVKFDKSFTISPDDFESNWTNLETSERKLCAIKDKSSPLLDLLENEGIKTMASTPEDSYPWRAFLYAKVKHSDVLFYIELVINSEEDSTAEIQLKSTTDNRTTIQDFLEFLEKKISRFM